MVARLAYMDPFLRAFRLTAESICRQEGVNLEQLQEAGRRGRVVRVRQRLAVALRQQGASLEEIGHLIGRTYTTVIYLLSLTQRQSRSGVSHYQLAESICIQEGITLELLQSAAKDPQLVRIRRRVAQALKRQRASVTEIGDIISRHHSTVISLLGKMKPR